MEKTGYTNNRVIKSAVLISEGRNKIMLAGHEAQGRKLLSKGISEAKQIFKDVKVSGNIKSIVQAELTFIEQELNHSTNPLAIKSLEIAKTSFTDALNSYHVLVKTNSYSDAEKTYSTKAKYRHKSLPKDAFHNACNSHITRLRNTLKSTEISRDMRSLYEQRVENIKAAKELYIELQKEALGLPANAKVKDNERER